MGIIVIATGEPEDVTEEELRKWNELVEKAETIFTGCKIRYFWSHGDEEHDLIEDVEGIIETIQEGGSTHLDEDGKIVEY